MTSDRGSASIAALGWIVVCVSLTVALGELSAHVLMAHQLRGSTDRAALGAADVLLGVVPGLPCDSAREILRREQFSLESCEVLQGSVRVTSGGTLRGISHRAQAHAGVANGGEE